MKKVIENILKDVLPDSYTEKALSKIADQMIEKHMGDVKIYNTMSNVKIVDVDMVRAMEFVRSACLEQGSFSLSCPASYGSSFFMGHLNRNTSDTIKEEVAAMITHLDKTQTVGVTFKD